MFELGTFLIKSHITACALLALTLGGDCLNAVSNAVILLFVSLPSRRGWCAPLEQEGLASLVTTPRGMNSCLVWWPSCGEQEFRKLPAAGGEIPKMCQKCVKVLGESLKNSREGSHQGVKIPVSQ